MAIDPLYTQHQRRFETFRFVYPVLSRRSGGISIGINLNPDKVCNFHCVYCQVDRVSENDMTFVDVDRLTGELDEMLQLVTTGGLFKTNKFRDTPERSRQLKDIAFSGDGEPTTHGNFDAIVETAAEVKRRDGLEDVKLVLITNASMFHRPAVQRALTVLDANQGEIWAKLDAGTESYFRQVNRAKIRLQRVLENIVLAARARPIVIQTLWMRIHDLPPSENELSAYCDRLEQIGESGGQLKAIQICTVARTPAESFVSPLSRLEVDAIVERVRQRTGLTTVGYYGVGD